MMWRLLFPETRLWSETMELSEKKTRSCCWEVITDDERLGLRKGGMRIWRKVTKQKC